MRYRQIPIILVLLISGLSAAASGEPNKPYQDTTPAITEAPPGGDFTLYSADGPVSLEDFRGKLVFLFFGYAVNHSAVTYLITPEGVLRFIFPHGTPPGILTRAVRHVLAGN